MLLAEFTRNFVVCAVITRMCKVGTNLVCVSCNQLL